MIHIQIRQRPEGTQQEISECISIKEGSSKRKGKVASDDRQESMLQTRTDACGRDKRAPDGLEELLQVWVSPQGISGDKRLCKDASYKTLKET